MIYVVKLILTLKARVITSSRGEVDGGLRTHTHTQLAKSSARREARKKLRGREAKASLTSDSFLLKF